MNISIKTGGPDYKNCLVNLASSILKKFGAETTADTLKAADTYLYADHTNVVVLLLDGMGTSVIEKHLPEDGFFRSHLVDTYYSVFPPTTVAATTSILSGLFPNEHGWLGWDMYYPELDKNVTVFRNREQLTERKGAEPTVCNEDGSKKWGPDSLKEPAVAAEFDAGFTYTPYKNIVEKINEAGGLASFSMPFMPPYPDTLEKVLARVKELCGTPGKKFIYAYWKEPDYTMHSTGTVSKETHDLIVFIEKEVRALAHDLSDTLLFVTADHGHIDCKNLCILDYPEVMDCLKRMPSFEPRTLNLFVKEEYKDIFPVIFSKYFGDDFMLLTREEALENKLFGPGPERPGLRDMIGDYLALAVSDVSVFNTHYEAQCMPGGHAGLTVPEVQIPLIVVET